MKTVLIITAVILTLPVLLLIPLRLELVYDGNAAKNKASAVLKYMFFRFRIYPKSEKSRKNDSDTPKNDENTADNAGNDTPDNTGGEEKFSFEREKNRIERYINIFNIAKDDAAKILRYGARHAVVFEKISVNIDFGFENAMHTGIFTGVLNGFVYGILALIHQNSVLRDMNVNIQPVFENPCFNSHFECILKIKNVHIIVIAVNVLRLYGKIRKEGSR